MGYYKYHCGLLKLILSLFIGLNSKGFLFSQNKQIKGWVVDSITKRPLVEASVFFNNNTQQTTTFSNGSFVIEVSDIEVRATIFKTGYKTQKKLLVASQRDTIFLSPLQEKLQEVTLNAEKKKSLLKLETGTIYLNKKSIESMPSILGDQDIVKYLSLSPGIQQPMEGQSSYFVRGGNGSMNHFEIDKMYIHQINHLGGLFNAINADMIKSVKFYKSSFDSYFGNRLSSVTDMKTLARPKTFSGKLSIGLIASKGVINVPINKATSILVSGRRTYLDLLKKPLQVDDENSLLHKNSNYSFYDYYVKISQQISASNTINIKLYRSKDNYSREKPSADSNKNGNWSNLIYGVDWTKTISPKSKNVLHLDRSKFKFNFFEHLLAYDYTLDNYYQRLTMENTYFYYGSRFDFSGGVNFNHVINNPKTLSAFYNNVPLNIINSPIQKANIFSVYSQIKSVSLKNFDFNIGGRLTLYNYGNTLNLNANNYLRFDPRITINQNLNANASLKFSYQKIHQFIHQTTITSFSLPSDFYLLSNAIAKPQYNHLFNLEYVYYREKLNFTAGIYYNTIRNFSELKNGTLNNLFEANLYDELVFGNLTGLGLELSVNAAVKNTKGALNYTLSKSQVQFKELNNGDPFNPVFDRPHNLNFSISHKLNSKLEIGGLFILMSGQNYSEPTSIRIIEELPVLEYDSANNSRFPDYHRLDLYLDYNLKKTQKIETHINLTVYNCYNRNNPFYINYQTQRNNDTSITVSRENQYLFPLMPTINWTLSF